MIRRGDIAWVDFGSQPAERRPAVVVQDDWLLDSQIGTVLVVPLTLNTDLERFPGNTVLPAEATGLERDSVAVVSQVGPVSREFLDPFPAGAVPGYLLTAISSGIKLVLGM